jgi:hypothetical protein
LPVKMWHLCATAHMDVTALSSPRGYAGVGQMSAAHACDTAGWSELAAL